MNVIKRIASLDLDDYQIFYEQIQPITDVESYPVIINRHLDLSLHTKTSLAKIMGEARLISTFQ